MVLDEERTNVCPRRNGDVGAHLNGWCSPKVVDYLTDKSRTPGVTAAARPRSGRGGAAGGRHLAVAGAARRLGGRVVAGADRADGVQIFHQKTQTGLRIHADPFCSRENRLVRLLT